ncbi:hypothetical protein A4S06_01060 [Erysipelotrichaceae bacterium MTC7]|nr:hypothetical protein A4S06_01060 [Erysipelotrichaceae bacterium MTC7]
MFIYYNFILLILVILRFQGGFLYEPFDEVFLTNTLLVSTFFGISAEPQPLPLRDNPTSSTCPYAENNEIDWNEVTKVIVLFDDGTSGENGIIETAKRNNVPIEYELVITPRFEYFKSVNWIVRNSVVSLSVDPKHPWTIPKEDSWRELIRFFQYHPMYTAISNPTKFSSMYNQYVCHADFPAGLKTPWNLEPATPNKGYWGFVGGGCN